MRKLLSVACLILPLAATACPINHWTARQELEAQGYEEIYFGEMPDQPEQHPFFARRAGQVCSGVVFLDESAPRISSSCRAPGGSSHH